MRGFSPLKRITILKLKIDGNLVYLSCIEFIIDINNDNNELNCFC